MTGGERGDDGGLDTASRRQVLAASGGVVASAVAGCSGDGGDGTGGTDSTATDDGATSTTTGTGDGIEMTGESAVDGIVIENLERGNGQQTEFVVLVTIRNTGSQRIELIDYNYELTLYDAQGTEIGRNPKYGSRGNTELAAGDTATVQVIRSVEDPEAVVRAEVTINCELSGFPAGVYCES